MTNDTIVVTGIGVLSSIGNSKEDFTESLEQGKNGRKPITAFDVSSKAYPNKQGACIEEDHKMMEQFDPSKIAYIAYKTAKEALDESGIKLEEEDKYRIGVTIGTSHGGNHTLIKFIKQKLNLIDEEKDYSLLSYSSPKIAALISDKLNVAGPTVTISTACSSSTTAIGYAIDLIKNNQVDKMIAGGADIFSELSFSGFNCLKAYCKEITRPLTQDRDGLLLGEGAAMFVLEKKSAALKRGAKIYAELLGYSAGNEAYHETSVDLSGDSALRVMKTAIDDAGVTVKDIDYINLHGTGTQPNDPTELKAVSRLFSDRLNDIKVSSTKSQIGHALGAAGCLELAATILAMQKGFIPPTINFDKPIEGFENIDVVPNKAIKKNIDYAISNSFAFAGHMSSIVLRNYQSENLVGV